MKRAIGWKIGFILVVVILSVWMATPLNDQIKLGLDLKGGIQVVLEVQVDEAIRQQTHQAAAQLKGLFKEAGIMFEKIRRTGKAEIEVTGIHDNSLEIIQEILDENLPNWSVEVSPGYLHLSLPPTFQKITRDHCIQKSITTIRNRVDKYGITEADVREIGVQGESKILVSLPGLDDPARIKDSIKSPAMLEFKHMKAGPFPTEAAALARYQGLLPEDLMILPANPRRMESGYYVLAALSVITGNDLKSASRGKGEFGGWEVHFSLTSSGAKAFRTYTAANIGKHMAIVFDKQIESIARINDILSYNSRIVGNYSLTEVDDMVLKLQTGALSAPMTKVAERVIGPSLGADSIKKGVTAAITGLITIMIFMVVYYRSAGINSVIALILDIILLIGAMAYMGFTLTLPGIAGIILTIGMAVDANVLIFERIKEELKKGKSPQSAIDLGFKKAFVTIFDANLTTVIAAFFLLQYGSGPMKGFAVTLIIGICVSMFSTLFVSKVIFHLVYATPQGKKKKSHRSPFQTGREFNFFKKEPAAAFMSKWKRRIAAGLSAVIILAGIVAYYFQGFNLGIDFTGGTMVEVAFKENISEEVLRVRLKNAGLSQSEIQRVDKTGNKFFVKTVKTNGNGLVNKEKQNNETIVDRLIETATCPGEFTILKKEMVGPKVSADLKQKVLLTTFWALLGMLVYIGFRFKLVYGLAAVLTLLHDVLVCLTIILLFKIEVSLPVFAALLTIIGYSLNDTIVIFDRVRDNLKYFKNSNQEGNIIENILHRSINQTLRRTVVTSGTTLAAVLALLFLGGEVLYTFAFTLMVGILVGTYSSIFQSCAWLALWKRHLQFLVFHHEDTKDTKMKKITNSKSQIAITEIPKRKASEAIKR
jgi:SecD/SecF fusion protein